jgi:transposase
MQRHALSDEQWKRIEPLLSATRTGPQAKLGDRHFVDAVLYRAKTGVPWRDLPGRFGPWKSVYNRFANWSKRGVWAAVLKALQLRVDRSGCIVDASVVRAHQDASGGKGGSNVTLLVTLAADSPRKSTPSSTARVGRSTSRSPRASDTK